MDLNNIDLSEIQTDLQSFQVELLKLVATFDLHSSLYWTQTLSFHIRCNDFFYWGCSDLEIIDNDEDLDILKKCLLNFDGIDMDLGCLLYCCHKRNMRPQGASYQYLPNEYKHLFDACGPERPIDMLNPHHQNEYN